MVLSHVLTQDESAPALADSADAETEAGAAVVPAALRAAGPAAARARAKAEMPKALLSHGAGHLNFHG